MTLLRANSSSTVSICAHDKVIPTILESTWATAMCYSLFVIVFNSLLWINDDFIVILFIQLL